MERDLETAKATFGRNAEELAKSLEERCALEGEPDQIRNVAQLVVQLEEVPDEVLNLLQDLRQSDGRRVGTWRQSEDLRDDKLGNIADLVKFPLECTSLFKGLG